MVHIDWAVSPAQATNTMSGLAALTLVAVGVRSVALGGARTEVTVVPSLPRTLSTAATLACPKALSWARTTTFLSLASPPSAFFRICWAVATSWKVWRPERKVYSLAAVTASVAAGPEM